MTKKNTQPNILILLALLFITLFNASCSNSFSEKNENDERADIDNETIVIDINKCSRANIQVDDIVEDVKYISLENDGEHYLTIPMNIKKVDSLIYVSDIDEHLFCFNKEGRFVWNVAVQGKAKNEVMKLYDFETDNNYVYLLDGMRSAILTFTHNGTFVSSKKLPFRAIKFKKQDENHWLFQLAPYTLNNKKENFQIAITNADFKIVNSKFSYNDGEAINTRTPFFENRDNALFYAPLYRRGVYRLTNKYEWKLAYYFDFHTPYIETAKKSEGIKEAVDKSLFYTYQNPLHNDKYLIQNFELSKKQRGTVFVDLHNNNAVFAQCSSPTQRNC